jgi:uncharacterized protein YfdQ (DUF2303 family)
MTTEAEAVAKIIRAADSKGHVIKTEDGREFLIVPDEFTHHDVTEPNKVDFIRPEFIKQSVNIQTADSLVEYVNRFKSEDTVLFADIATDTIVAQIDYHEPHGEFAGYVSHRASLTLSRSIEWQEWTRISGRLMEQLEFARFIEENAADIRAPAGADLLESIRDLQAHRKVNFMKAVRTSSENETFEYSEETTAKTKQGGIEIPTKFQLGIPVYFGEGDNELFAFLRWKLGDGSLTLGIQLHRPEHVRQAVFQGIVTQIAQRTECTAVFGKL